MDGLIIKDPYAQWILDGEKTIELRGCDTSKRGKVAIIKSGTKHVYGTVDIIGTFRIETRSQYEKLRLKHCVGAEKKDVPYKKLWVWVINNPVKFEEPMPYKPKIGQQVWVKDVLSRNKLENVEEG